MNFWHMQLHQDNEKWDWAREKEVLQETGYIGMGVWDEGWPSNPQQTNFEKNMKVGDIVAIRRGSEWIALTRVLGDYEFYESEQTTELDWFKRRRKVDVLDWYDSSIYGFERCGSTQGTLTKCNMSTNAEALTNQTIKKWYERVMEDNTINEVVKLLKYKNQVILQGPPGTGKTRLAKLIAKSLTDIERKGKPQDILDNLVQSFDSSTDKVQSNRAKNNKLLIEFRNAFPAESLGSMTLDDFSIGKGKNDSFCWWIERGLEDLGKFSPGSSNNYPIYWSKDKNEYVVNKKVGDDIKNEESVIKIIANQLVKLVQETDLETSIAFFGKSFTLKILNSYYPDRYFPINSENALNNVLKLFGAYDRTMNLIEKNKKLYAIYHDKKDEFKKDITVNEFAGLIWNNFNLKEGELLSETDEVMTQGQYKVIQFHPAYTYEDFVRGVVAETNEDGNIYYKVENKVLAQFAKKAYENPNSNYVLIIDEINRANLPSVLGELIYALEYRGETVESMYELLDKDDEDGQSHNTGRNITLPKNLYIIGTMNTADRSVGHIDYAIRRRFAFYDVPPTIEVIKFAKAKALFKQVQALFKTDGSGHLSSDFNTNDVQLGHSYFLPSNEEMSEHDFHIELKNKLDYEIKPILLEYIKDGVLLDSARENVEALNV